MELVERYLQAISTFLPARNSADILRELRENILSQMDEKEADLGRPLTAEEEEDLIRQHGHPVVVAARYSPQRQLIGSAIFPFYWTTLKASLLTAIVVRAIGVLIGFLISSGNAQNVASSLSQIIPILFWVFAAITLAFAGLEYAISAYKISSKFKWKPSSLPALRHSRRTISRAESVAGLIFGMAGAVWWQAVPTAPFLLLGPAALVMLPAPAWSVFHFTILVFIVLRTLLFAVDLLRPHVTLTREWIEIGFDGAQIVLIGLMLRAGALVVANPGMADHAKAEQIVQMVNRTLPAVLAIALCIVAAQLIWKCYRMYREIHGASASFTASTLA
jgi:hypothetical protein